ncbi:MAG: hypothetical protein E7543_01585 [Ruminococcaceae bacterium]|nr:hypothetical protein [Oscillospiraceae bacterium]MBQ9914492.1 hypothetical protein [Clostridia bacterium]
MTGIKKILTCIGVVAFIAVFAIWMLGSDTEHIEDTNGPDIYKLQEISDSNIINMDVGALNFSVTDTPVTLKEYKSDKFTGVAELYQNNIYGNRFDITLYNLWVESGNFRVVLVHNGEIVHEFKLNELMQTYTLENPNGSVSLRIAGESADFTFSYDLV